MRRTKIMIVSVLLILATTSAYAVSLLSDSNAVHAKWTASPSTPVFLAITGTTRENVPERLNASLSMINQAANGPVSHYLYVAVNVTGFSWRPNATNYHWANTTINSTPVSAVYIGHSPDGFNDEWAFGIFPVPYNQAINFQISLTLSNPNPLTQTGRPYGNYDLTIWTVAVGP